MHTNLRRFPLFNKTCSSSCHQGPQISAFLFVMILSCLVLSRLSLPMLFYPPNKSCRASLVSLTDDLTSSIQRFQMPECQQLLLGNLSQESFKWTGPSVPLSANNWFRTALAVWLELGLHLGYMTGRLFLIAKYYSSTQNERRSIWAFLVLLRMQFFKKRRNPLDWIEDPLHRLKLICDPENLTNRPRQGRFCSLRENLLLLIC